MHANQANLFASAAPVSVNVGGTLDFGGFAQTIDTVTLAGGALVNGDLTGTVMSTGGMISGLGGSADVVLTSGLTTAAGTNNYTGATTVGGGSELRIAGALTGSDVTVDAGGTLSGIGKIGDPTINAGGTLAPGTPTTIGTLTIVGPLSFAAGSFYDVKISSAANDRTNVVGVTTIAGGTVTVKAGTGTYSLASRYTILNATGGVNGTFGSVTSNLAFLKPELSYDANNVFLILTNGMSFTTQVPDYRSAAATQNQRAVASGLTSGGVATGGLGPILTALNQTTVTQAQAVFDGLSGEGISAAQNAAQRSTVAFTASIFDQTTVFDAGTANSITLTDAASAPLFYAEPASSPIRLRDPATVQRTWRAWAAGFGGVENMYGTSGAGSAAQSSTLYGGTLGVDYQMNPDHLIGLATGGSQDDFDVGARATSGSTTGGHIAVYDLATFGRFYGASSNSFSYFSNKTTRAVTGFGGLTGETERGMFDSHEFRSRLEFGRHFDADGATITPFLALEIAELRSNGFTETAGAGPGQFALALQGQNSASVPAFLGARTQGKMLLDGMVIAPSLQAAYVHDFAPQRTQIGALAALPGSTFLVEGARAARDTAQIKAGFELMITPASIIFASFDGEFSGQSQFLGGNGGFKYRW